MLENSFVQMLTDVAGGEVADPRDVALARRAGSWALNCGRWQLHLHNSFFVPSAGMDFWVLAVEQRLEIRVRLGGSAWRTHATHAVAHLGHGLDLLAAEGLIPARYCTLGRQALEDHAEVLRRSAARMVNGPDGDSLAGWACGLSDAAQSATRFAGAQVQVLT